MTYTRDQLEAMTDRELDAVVADALFGKPFKIAKSGIRWYRCGDDEYAVGASRVISTWSPSTTWSGMGLVVEKMTADGHEMRLSNKTTSAGCWWAYLHNVIVQAPSLPRAVCIAAVLAVQEQKP